MKKNISAAYMVIILPLINFISLSSMYGEIDTSTIIKASPTTQGLGLSYYFGDKIYGETTNTILMIKQHQFDPDNLSCHNKLRKAIVELCCEKPNITETIKLVSLMMNHFRAPDSPANLKKLNLEFVSFYNIHTFLNNEKTKLQNELKIIIKDEDKNYLIEHNAEVANIKQLCIDKTAQLKKMRTDYITKRNQQTSEKVQKIKEIKNSIVELHQLNKKQSVFLPENKKFDAEYCSDTEETLKEVEKSYSDENLIKKIKVDNIIKLTNTLTINQINEIEIILHSFYKIQPININSLGL